MNPSTIAHMMAHRIAQSQQAMKDKVDVLSRLHVQGQIVADEYTNQRTLVTLFSLINVGFVEREGVIFTLSQAGKDMIARKP